MAVGSSFFSAARLRCCLLCLLAAVFFAPHHTFAVEGQAPAEAFFRKLPLDIFENTGERFTDTDKELLFAKGYSPTWHLAYNDADTLVVSALDAVRSEVILHLFRGPTGGMAVLNARTQGSCACEFWRWDASGGLVPEAPPELPPMADFFTADTPPLTGVQVEVFFCLTDYRELEAKPRFWNADGAVDVTPTARVRWTWNGTGFTKVVTPGS